MPWANLWAPLASAFSSRAYTDHDVSWVRDKAGAFIVEALESGQSVYRLYHQALADYFHDAGLNEERNRRIAKALIASVPDGVEGGKLWQEAHLYVLQHLATHAARCRMLSELMRDPLYLLAADSARLLPAIDRSISMLPSEITRVYKQTAHRLHEGPIEDKASYLEFNARKQKVFDMAEQIARLPLARRWVSKWALWTDSQMHRVLEGHTDADFSPRLTFTPTQATVAYLEVYCTLQGGRAPAVKFEIAASSEGPPLASATGKANATKDPADPPDRDGRTAFSDARG